MTEFDVLDEIFCIFLNFGDAKKCFSNLEMTDQSNINKIPCNLAEFDILDVKYNQIINYLIENSLVSLSDFALMLTRKKPKDNSNFKQRLYSQLTVLKHRVRNS